MHELRHGTTAEAHVGRHRAPSGGGLRRVELVRVIVTPTRTTAEATGVLHRYPRTVAISLAAATRLVARGVPLRVEHGADHGVG